MTAPEPISEQPARPIRVLQILEATIGGTKRHLLDLCTLLDPERFHVTVACPRVRSEAHGDTSFVADLRRAGIAVALVPLVRRIQPFEDARALWEMIRVIRRGRYDIIHAHSSKAGFIGRQAALLDPRARVVYSPHGFYFLNFENRLKLATFRWIERLAGRTTDVLITLSRGEQAAALREKIVPSHRVRLVENGIAHVDGLPRAEARARLDVPLDIPVVGTISRFTPQKAPFDVVEAVAELVRRRPTLQFLWFGDGELRTRVENEIRRRRLTDSIRVLGYRPDARSLLPALDVFMLASRWEGLPYTIMETMDAGVPVVGTDVVGTQDFIDPGRTGLLVPPGKAGRLAAAVDDLLTRPDYAAIIAQAAADDVGSRFNRAEMVRKIAAIYAQLAGDSPRG